MSDDRTTISLSAEGDRIIKGLVKAGIFRTEVAAFEAAASLALATGLSVERGELENATTKWNVGSLDSRFRGLIVQFSQSGEDQPFDAATLLAEAGLRRLGAALEDEEDFSVVLGIDASPAEH